MIKAYEDLAIAIYERAKIDHVSALIKIEKYHEKLFADLPGELYPPFRAYATCKEIIKFIHKDVYMSVKDSDWEKAVVEEAERKLKKKLVYARKYADFQEMLKIL